MYYHQRDLVTITGHPEELNSQLMNTTYQIKFEGERLRADYEINRLLRLLDGSQQDDFFPNHLYLLRLTRL